MASMIARHEKCAPFACNSPVRLYAEEHPLYPDHEIVYEKCQCGKIIKTWSVLPEAMIANNDDQDDGA